MEDMRWLTDPRLAWMLRVAGWALGSRETWSKQLTAAQGELRWKLALLRRRETRHIVIAIIADVCYDFMYFVLYLDLPRRGPER